MNDNDPKQAAQGAGAQKVGHRSEREKRAASLLVQIGKLIGLRYGGPCNDDDAESYYNAALPYLVEIAAERRRLDRLDTTWWLRWCTPVLVPIALPDPDWLRQIQPEALRKVRASEQSAISDWRRHAASRFSDEMFGHSSRALSKLLCLRADEMRAADIRFLSPIDRAADELAAERRARDAAYRKAKRDQEGVRPRSSSMEALKPWTVIGIGRRTFYKLLKAGDLPALPDVPRGADPAPHLAAFAAAFRSRQEAPPDVLKIAA
ncbi:hypothetical protein AFCDBAGC_1872 [Methylobacterium cerastii]|uniref:Uncharacterized protein n=1 Tax=Methylobacterium cerastii TaxID=932741 RepID=A0ABQ4QFM4_9HYPH|nr:hypothetical protein [Methylobacterium cerastii]GJD44010.1 hypothetical protein AFCDBAGC_1872 [Methylobacterium cerastii]